MPLEGGGGTPRQLQNVHHFVLTLSYQKAKLLQFHIKVSWACQASHSHIKIETILQLTLSIFVSANSVLGRTVGMTYHQRRLTDLV